MFRGLASLIAKNRLLWICLFWICTVLFIIINVISCILQVAIQYVFVPHLLHNNSLPSELVKRNVHTKHNSSPFLRYLMLNLRVVQGKQTFHCKALIKCFYLIPILASGKFGGKTMMALQTVIVQACRKRSVLFIDNFACFSFAFLLVTT